MQLRGLTLFVVLHVATIAAAEPVIFLPPTGETQAANELGYLMHTHAEHAIVDAGQGAVVGLRQILNAAEALDLPVSAWSGDAGPRLAALVGSNRFVVGKLVGKAAPYTLELRVVERGKPGPVTSTTLPSSSVAAVNAGARAIATLAAGHAVPPSGELPSDMRDDAVMSYGRCTIALMQQAIALESPAPLRTDELDRSMKACRETIAQYPGLDAARAKLALALALSSKWQESVDLLRAVPTKRYEPSLWMAHYWIATVHRSPEAGLAVLQEVVKRFPSSLLARTFLVDHLFALRRFDEALVAANAVLASVPGSTLARARVSTILARLGRNEEALRIAEEAAKAAPQDPRALTSLASRYLDVGRSEDALATLRPLKADARVLNLRGTAFLRLGKLDDAQRAFSDGHAATDATPLDWRTRGRLLAGLLRVAVARGDTAATRRLVAEAQRDGFVAFLHGLADPSVDAALDRAHASDSPQPVATGVKGPRFVRPKEALPFALDPSGQIDPQSRARVTPPTQLELIRF